MLMLPHQHPNYTRILQNYLVIISGMHVGLHTDYNEIVDELTEKLYDLEIYNLDHSEWPDFELRDFPFLHEWESGLMSSTRVDSLLSNQWTDVETVAKVKLTRSLTNFMFKHEDAADYLKITIQRIMTEIYPRYVNYLKAILKFFSKAAECDKNQLPLTWLEITIHDGTISDRIDDLSLNQVIRQLTAFVSDQAERAFSIKDNAVCFETYTELAGHKYHWILGPENYIKIIKSIFDITDSLKMELDLAYLKNKLGEYSA